MHGRAVQRELGTECDQQATVVGRLLTTLGHAYRRQVCSKTDRRLSLIWKPKFHVSSFLVANVTRKSLTCYKDVVRVGRVTRMLQRYYEETAPVEFSLHHTGRRCACRGQTVQQIHKKLNQWCSISFVKSSELRQSSRVMLLSLWDTIISLKYSQEKPDFQARGQSVQPFWHNTGVLHTHTQAGL